MGIEELRRINFLILDQLHSKVELHLVSVAASFLDPSMVVDGGMLAGSSGRGKQQQRRSSWKKISILKKSSVVNIKGILHQKI